MEELKVTGYEVVDRGLDGQKEVFYIQALSPIQAIEFLFGEGVALLMGGDSIDMCVDGDVIDLTRLDTRKEVR